MNQLSLRIVTEVFAIYSIITYGISATDVDETDTGLEDSDFLDKIVDIYSTKATEECSNCSFLIEGFLIEKSVGITVDEIAAQGEEICKTYKFEHDNVCDGIIKPTVEVLDYIVDNKNITSQEICSLYLKCEEAEEYFKWTINIPEGITAKKKPDSNTTFRIGHISDIHYDPYYTEGKKLDCGEPICCQYDQPDAEEGEDECGYWSSKKDADCPLRLVEEAVDQLVLQKPDYIYFTGDLVSHRTWGTSPEFNSQSITEILDLFIRKFSDSIPIYPVLGNHESHPVNVYAPVEITQENISASWLYNLLVDKWSQFKWFDNDVLKTILSGGYYSIKPKNGLRVIVLNNNVCSRKNWWNLYNTYDPYRQLQWLANTLLEAETNNESVHILYHLPMYKCLKSWSQAYNKLLIRFSNTIAAQFNGHTHRDQFFLHFNDENQPVAVTISGGSLIPDKSYPNYKIYHVDSNSFNVVDSETYTFDLKVANKKKDEPIEWYKLYSFSDAFGVKLTPSELYDLTKQMSLHKKLTKTYYNYYYSNSTKGQKKCKQDCREKLICKILTTIEGETKLCDDLPVD